MSRLLRHAALQQARRMLREVEETLPCTAEDLRVDALGTLHALDEIRFVMVADSDTDSGCSVPGAYLDDPPTIAVAESTSAGRRAFTALHELGHHLQRHRISLMDALVERSDGGLGLEDEACNSFAGQVLLPDEVSRGHFSVRGPTADDVVALWDAAHASRAAVCVRAAEYLRSPGHVVLLEPTGRVSFAASRGLPPLRRGSSQSHAHVIRSALQREPMRGRGRIRLRYRDGIVGDELYVQVAEMGGYAVAVLVIDGAPWEKFSPPPVDTGPQAREWICDRCDREYQSFAALCSKCGVPPCPECERCSCRVGAATAEQMCDRCYITKTVRMFESDSTTCLDCS